MALFCAVCRIVQQYAPLGDLPRDTELIPLTRGAIVPSDPPLPVARKEILRFIAEPFCAAQFDIVKNSEFLSIASESCTDRASKKENLFSVRLMVDSRMVTNFFSF